MSWLSWWSVSGLRLGRCGRVLILRNHIKETGNNYAIIFTVEDMSKLFPKKGRGKAFKFSVCYMRMLPRLLLNVTQTSWQSSHVQLYTLILRKYEKGTQVRNLHSYLAGPVELLRTLCELWKTHDLFLTVKIIICLIIEYFNIIMGSVGCQTAATLRPDTNLNRLMQLHTNRIQGILVYWEYNALTSYIKWWGL